MVLKFLFSPIGIILTSIASVLIFLSLKKEGSI